MAKTAKKGKSAAYERQKAAALQRIHEISAEGRDIGPPPAPVSLQDRDDCIEDFRRFCLTYFPEAFALPFSPDHLKVIAKIERAVLTGGLFAMAMPRGSGKTTLSEYAALWSLVYGHRAFVVLVGSDLGAAQRMLDSLKVELETNDKLGEDFPEVCYPIQKLERISHRCRGQTSCGEPTYIGWNADSIVLPTIQGSQASGSVVKVAGLTGSIRGLKHKTALGRSLRPDLVIVDDPQTDESARSASQCQYRERVLSGAVLGMAGPGKKISGIMPCTVISPGDVADRILSPQIHPEWNGERTKLLYALPTRLDLWEQYAAVRAESFRAGRAGIDATEFYRQHQADMDQGAVVAWPERKKPDELTAVQHAMNLRIDDLVAFAAEYQNEPLPEVETAANDLTAEEVVKRLSRQARGLVPVEATRLTAFVDVQASVLFWLVAGWAEDFSGWVVDYGAFPKQNRAYWTLSQANPTLASAVKAAGLEGQIYGGLEALAGELLGRAWPRSAGGEARIERCLIDANWGQSTDVVYQFARQSAHSALITPSHGKFVGASSQPLNARKSNPGDRVGLHWFSPVAQKRGIRHVVYDTNFWKSFLRQRLKVSAGDRGGLWLWGDSPDLHRMFADHLLAEYPVQVQGRGRTVDEWKLRPERPDNHWWDCLVGSAVAASMQGASLPDLPGETKRPERKKVSFADLQRAARERR